jgi:ABC-2 type transport system permease protein
MSMVKKIKLSLNPWPAIRRTLIDLSRGRAFWYRNYYTTKRNFIWFFVHTFYCIVSTVAVVYIGVYENDPALVRNLLIGCLVWTHLGTIFDDIGNSVAYERWEGTIEYTFMAPVSRVSHLLNISFYSMCLTFVQNILMILACQLVFDVHITMTQFFIWMLILLLSTISFIGLSILAAILPLLSVEAGAPATHVIEGVILLVSGIYYPITVFPYWLQVISTMSPATYAIDLSRKVLENPTVTMSALSFDINMLLLLGVFYILLGFYSFFKVEKYTKITGKLKRNG